MSEKLKTLKDMASIIQHDTAYPVDFRRKDAWFYASVGCEELRNEIIKWMKAFEKSETQRKKLKADFFEPDCCDYGESFDWKRWFITFFNLPEDALK